MIYDIRSTISNTPLPLIPELLSIHHHQEPIHRTNGVAFYQWFYCVRGRGELLTGQQRSIITEGQGFLIYPNIAHTYKPLTTDWTVHCVGFSGSMCAEMLKFLHMQNSGVYHFSDKDVFARHLFSLYNLLIRPSLEKESNAAISFDEFLTGDSSKLLQNKISPDTHVVHVRFPGSTTDTFFEASKICYSFLLDLSKCITIIPPSMYIQENGTVLKMIAYLEENYTHAIVLEDMAAHIGLSKEYMCTLFKSAMHQTIMTYLLELRIAQARILLIQYPEKTVKDIAAMCGFESPSYFGSQFKRITSTTPENYRRGLSV